MRQSQLGSTKYARRLLASAALALVLSAGAQLAIVSTVQQVDAQVPPISVGSNTTVGVGIGSAAGGATVSTGVTTGNLLNGVTPLAGGLVSTAGGIVNGALPGTGGLLNGVLPGTGGLLNGLVPGAGGLLNGLLPTGVLSGAAGVTGPLGTGASTGVMGGIP
jgi:hypothetical protein